MRRRAFISLLSGAAAWSLAARAQQAARVRRIGVLLNITADDPQSQARLAAFAQGLQQLGWTIGQNVLVDYRWGRGDAEAMRTHAAELVALGPDIILAHSSAALAPLLQVTRTVPIVFTIVADPVGAWVPLLRLRATHYHTVAQERCCASQQKLRADVACGSNSVVPVMSRPLFPRKQKSQRATRGIEDSFRLGLLPMAARYSLAQWAHLRWTRMLLGRGAGNPLLRGGRGFRPVRGCRNHMNDLVAAAF
jgi:hypothetical protein